MTARLLRSVADSAATPAFGLSRTALLHAASVTATTNSSTPPAPDVPMPAAPAAAPVSAPAASASTPQQPPLTDPQTDAACGAANAGETLTTAVPSPTTDHLRPVFSSWAQVWTTLAQRLTLLRHSFGLTVRNQHVLHVPCRRTGQTYRVPVALLTDGDCTRIIAITIGTASDDTCDEMQRTWIADAHAARFVVLARGRQQRIVEVQPVSDEPNSAAATRLLVQPDRAWAGPPSVSSFAALRTVTPSAAPTATRRHRAASTVA